ncbi:hypothetical protein [Streptomyces sp. NPDC052721]|uniref:hypothetical protein n=1 Tax=Streptomyces sp. NPDC052721 TaxID=3154955 RepID=UPI0034124232
MATGEEQYRLNGKRMPDGIGPDEAAPLLCAGVTGSLPGPAGAASSGSRPTVSSGATEP